MPNRKLHAAFERYDTEAARTAAHAGVDEVHDFRVTIRRLDQALEILGRWLAPKRTASIRRKTRKRLKLAGRVRDRDIALELIAELALEVPADVRERIAADRARFAAKLEKRAAKSIKRVAPDGAPPLAELAARLVPKLAAEFLVTGAKLAADPGSRRRLHRFRITAKRFRYTMELVVEGDAALEEAITRVRTIQTALGNLQDCVATRKLLAGAGRDALEQEEHKRLKIFQDAWATNFGPGAVAPGFPFSLQ